MMYWNSKNKNCGMMIVETPGGIFKKGEKYPYVNLNGVYYLLLVPINGRDYTQFLQLDCYGSLNNPENVYFKLPMGLAPEEKLCYEDATFVKEATA